jgi:hypothetical protein
MATLSKRYGTNESRKETRQETKKFSKWLTSWENKNPYKGDEYEHNRQFNKAMRAHFKKAKYSAAFKNLMNN